MKNKFLKALALSLIVSVGSFVSTANATVIVIDNDDQLVKVEGTWTTSNWSGFGFVGSDYLHDGNGDGEWVKYFIGQHVDFFGGSWMVEMNWKEHGNRASNTPVEVFDMFGNYNLQTVNQKVADGGWYDIGTFVLNADSYVWINPESHNANGYVIADAFRFTSVPEPSTLAIFALGLIGLASRRFKKQA